MSLHLPTTQGMSSTDLARVIQGVDVAKASCQYDSDKDFILGNIRSDRGIRTTICVACLSPTRNHAVHSTLYLPVNTHILCVCPH